MQRSKPRERGKIPVLDAQLYQRTAGDFTTEVPAISTAARQGARVRGHDSLNYSRVSNTQHRPGKGPTGEISRVDVSRCK